MTITVYVVTQSENELYGGYAKCTVFLLFEKLSDNSTCGQNNKLLNRVMHFRFYSYSSRILEWDLLQTLSLVILLTVRIFRILSTSIARGIFLSIFSLCMAFTMTSVGIDLLLFLFIIILLTAGSDKYLCFA